MSARDKIDKPKGTMSIFIAGEAVDIISGKFKGTMNFAVDEATANIAYRRGQSSVLDDALRPFALPQALVYLGPDLVLTGTLYDTSVNAGPNGVTRGLEIYSATADALDSDMEPPYEFNNVKLSQIAANVLKRFSIEAIFDADEGEAFKRATADMGDKVLSFLIKLAQQRGLIISTNKKAQLVFRKARTAGLPVTVLAQDEPGALEWTATFSGRARYGIYRALSQEPKNKNKAEARDTAITDRRIMLFRADETTGGTISQAAQWRKNKTLANAIGFSVPVFDWYDDNGDLWEPNSFVAVSARELYIDNGYKMLIRSVDFELSGSGRRAVLDLVPPEVFSNEEIKEPWAT